jgi:ketosteroid isomerase-like protein
MISNLNIEKDKAILLSILEEISKSMTGAQSTKHWTDETIWFDIPPFASKGIKSACKKFDEDFSSLKSIDVEILQTETFINGDMGVICSVQRWNIVQKDDTVNPPMLLRQTDCFERQNGEWKVIHEHISMPAAPGWDGMIISEK